MKKILYILSIALAAAVACNKQTIGPELRDAHGPLAEGTPVTLHFSLSGSQIQTKGSMTEEPLITPDSTLYVLVFNANSGALLEAVKATIMEPGVEGNTLWPYEYEEGHEMSEDDIVNTDFNATVSAGSAPRYLQFVVDPHVYEPTSGNQFETGLGVKESPIFIGDSESEVAAKLYTKGDATKGFQDGKTSYWQRLYLPRGLNAYTYPGGAPTVGLIDSFVYYPSSDGDKEKDYYIDANGLQVNYGDYVNGYGNKITDGTGYIASTEVAALLKHIPMVRNFVNIVVSKANGGNFTPVKAVLVNTPKAGFVAPYSGPSGFVKYYLYGADGLEQLTTVGTNGIKGTGYTAPVPNNEINTDCPGEDDCIPANNGVINLFMYERGIPTANPTQLLVYGSLEGSNTWLKIDITDEDGNYIPFYRDFTYEMKIGTITGTTGHGSMSEAYKGPSIGNPSASPETANLTQVTDGKGVGIWVDFIDYPSFNPERNTVQLRYKFWNATEVLSSTAEITVEHQTSTPAVTTDSLDGEEYDGTGVDGADGWYVVNVPLEAQDQNSVWHSVVRISGTTTNSAGKTVTLYRDVHFRVMKTQTMSVSLDAINSDNYGQSTTATITVPDGLSYKMFPLVIRIEAYNGSLNPSDTDMAVEHGTSTFSVLDEDNTLFRDSNFYWFNKTISYEEYSAGTRVFKAHFKTVFGEGQNATTVLFSDAKGQFYPVTVALAAGS